MPEPTMSSWADEIEDGDTLPLPQEKVIDKNTKQIISYERNDAGKKVKIVRTYKIERKLVSKVVAQRKALAKFGMSENDRPGPNPATTIVSVDEVSMQFVGGPEEDQKDSEDKSALDLIKDKAKNIVKCRICKEDHWTTNCPYKDTLGPLKDTLTSAEDKEAGGGAGGAAPAGGGAAAAGGKYVPPSRRGVEGSTARDRIGESLPQRRQEDTHAIRVSNLSENTQEQDLQELFKPFGAIGRIYLAKDKITGQCKGFAFINYYKKEDAAKAIATLNRYGYDNLILNVEWAKPSA